MSTFSVKRNENGQSVVSVKGVKDYHVNNLGTATGDMSFSMGSTTDGSNATVLQVAQNDNKGKLEFTLAATDDNFQFSGSKIDAKVDQDLDTAYNIEWNANNSEFDSTAGNSQILFEATEASYNNKVSLGDSLTVDKTSFDNMVVDRGKNNTYLALDTSSNSFETKASSSGVIIQTGSGDNTFLVGGKDGIISGGSGNDTFKTLGTTAHNNILLGNEGADTLDDFGAYTLFFGGTGADTANMHGEYGIANLGFNESGNVVHYSGGSYNAAFTGETATASDNTVYDYKDIMKLRGWSLEDFLKNSTVDGNPYYSLVSSKIAGALE